MHASSRCIEGYDGAERSLCPSSRRGAAGGRGSRKAVATNKRDYRSLEREYITSRLSIRELCRKHDISAHSSVVVQAQKNKWAEKRGQYQAQASDVFIERHAARQADREAEVRDHALDAIDESISRFREDLRATEKKRVDGEWIEVPAWRMKPKDLALLIDRLQVLFDRPSAISQHQELAVTSERPIEALNRLVELTRDHAAPPVKVVSPLPRTRRLDD